MKKHVFISFFVFLLFFDVCKASVVADTIKPNQKNNKISLWLRQPSSIIFNLYSVVRGTFKFDENGFYFNPSREIGKQNIVISYAHLFNDIFIDWKEVEKIKIRSSRLLFKDHLYIKMKDKRRYYFFTNQKKNILKVYKSYTTGK